MPKRSSTPRRKRQATDPILVAAHIFEQVTGEKGPGGNQLLAQEKNPAAVALGTLGGLKGGTARAEKLSARRRKQIAKKAAAARWRSKTR